MRAKAPASLNDVERLLAAVRPRPPARPRPSLVLVSGLPGTGKTRLCRELRRLTDAVVLESDAARKLIFPQPDYSYLESRRLFRAIHAAIERLLGDGLPTVLDATNLTEWQRQPLYEIAERQKARIIVVKVEAPAAVVRRRLAKRARDADASDQSDAGLDIYERMKGQEEKIRRRHFVVDTSRDTKAALQAIVRAMRASR
jgi:predicted kinase